ncbi:MAG: hypothetical protein K8U03_00280, partial [Planctomycetia bacterium]|nr:hypothetical protein [Planctomycetia bacterium]
IYRLAPRQLMLKEAVGLMDLLSDEVGIKLNTTKLIDTDAPPQQDQILLDDPATIILSDTLKDTVTLARKTGSRCSLVEMERVPSLSYMKLQVVLQDRKLNRPVYWDQQLLVVVRESDCLVMTVHVPSHDGRSPEYVWVNEVLMQLRVLIK